MPLFKRSLSQKGRTAKAEGGTNDGGPPSQAFLGLELTSGASLGSLVGPDHWEPQSAPGSEATPAPSSNAQVMPSAPPTGSAGRSSRSESLTQPRPYHRPWNRDLGPVDGGADSNEGSGAKEGTAMEEAPAAREEVVAQTSSSPSSPNGRAALPRSWSRGSPQKKKAGPPPSAYSARLVSVASIGVDADPESVSPPPLNFRVSPNAVPTSTPAQTKRMIDTARQVSLRKSKAPSELNIVVTGARMTGKTSWIRTLLSTLDLGFCSDETRLAASHFGIASSSHHPSRETDPVTPLPTRAFNTVSGIELHPSSMVPLAALEQGMWDSTATMARARSRPMSAASTRASLFSAGGGSTGRLQLSLCDTPGFDLDAEDEFETDRKASKVVHYIEDKLAKTLTEEGRVQRSGRAGNHVHLVLYFIDPRHLVERNAARRDEARKSRYGQVSGEQRKSRTYSESQTLGRSAQTARLMKRSESTPLMGDAGDQEQEPDDDECTVEGLSSAELSILARLSQLSNVLPIIAKADTLTLTRLHEVRQAVRRSLRAAKIDLGTFDIGTAKGSRAKKAGGEGRAAAEGEPTNGEEVKVIRIRRRRSVSASGRIDRPTSQAGYASTAGHGGDMEDEEGEGGSPPEQKTSLEDDGPSSEDLLRLVPLSVFVPEPVRTTARKSKVPAARRPSSAEEDMSSQGGHVPPVPPLPRELSNTQLSSEVLDSSATNGAAVAAAGSPPPASEQRQQPMRTLVPSGRYERNYRWGTARVLDPEQCDFGLLRTAILGTHLDALRESTAQRYESFRSHRLELNRLLRQGLQLP